jgi:hypothetical protein
MKSIEANGILENVFDRNSEDKNIIRNWLLDGSPIINETLNHQEKPIQITSHENFKFIF